MNKWYGFRAGAALIFALLLCGHTAAFAQSKSLGNLGSQLPNVHLGVDKLGVQAILIPSTPKTLLPVLPPLLVPGVAVRVAPPILPGTPLAANVNVNTGGSGPLVAVGVNVSGPALQLDVGGGILDAPANEDVRVPDLMAVSPGAGQTMERSLDLVPACR